MKTFLLFFAGWFLPNVATVTADPPRAAKDADLLHSQQVQVTFFSKAPLEDIEATTTAATSVLRLSTGEVAFAIPIRSFAFAKSLMEEHFNENYLESDKYPQATFTGRLSTPVDVKASGARAVRAVGALTIHGVTRTREIPVTLQVRDGVLTGHGTFQVRLADHAIEIPTLVFHKIAEVVDVTLEISYAAPRP